MRFILFSNLEEKSLSDLNSKEIAQFLFWKSGYGNYLSSIFDMEMLDLYLSWLCPIVISRPKQETREEYSSKA